MNLIDKEDDIALGFNFLDKTFDTALKLTAELSSGNQSSKIQQINFFFH